MTKQMRTLIWKEWMQQRLLLVPAVGLIFVPHLAASLLKLSDTHFSKEMISGFALLASALTALGRGILAYGQELNEHTLSYSSTRPVSLRKAFASKVIVGIALTVIIAAAASFSIAIAIATVFAIPHGPGLVLVPVVGPVYGLLVMIILVTIPMYSVSLFVTLAIRSKLPAVLLAHLAAAGIVVMFLKGYWIVCLILSLVMLFASYHLAIRYCRGGW